jgi:hypothetical protein
VDSYPDRQAIDQIKKKSFLWLWILQLPTWSNLHVSFFILYYYLSCLQDSMQVLYFIFWSFPPHKSSFLFGQIK